MQKKLQELGKEKGSAAGEFLSDWHDNFAYDQLDREFKALARRIEELNTLLNSYQPVETTEQTLRVSIGSTVEFLMDGVSNTLTIGCSSESEGELDLLSYDCPLGRLLAGLTVGETRKGRIGPREVEIKIIRLHPPSFRYNQLQEKLEASLLAKDL